MWGIGVLSEEYRRRMYALLELYARPMSRAEPVICIDEKSLQLIGNSREPMPMAPHRPTKLDYEYVRHGTTNLFVAKSCPTTSPQTLVWQAQNKPRMAPKARQT